MKFIVASLFTLLLAIGVTAQPRKSMKPKPTLYLADSLFLIGDWKAAQPIYESVLKSAPENSLAWNRLGFSYHNLMNYDKAISSYFKSIAYKPAPAIEVVVQSRLARVYSIKNEIDNSIQYLNKAIQIGYANLNELETNSDFKNLRTDARYQEIIKRTNLNAYPCLANAKAREFDFWIGEWDAFVTGTITLAGKSKIEMASGGCMILENWTSMGGAFNGKSMNFVDPVTQKWKQIWVGSSGINANEFLNGEYRDGAMRFEFETTGAGGTKQMVHFYFFNQGTDQVRQLHETSTDDGKTWVTTYDFTYKRIR